jgi:hypothetical protein
MGLGVSGGGLRLACADMGFCVQERVSESDMYIQISKQILLKIFLVRHVG